MSDVEHEGRNKLIAGAIAAVLLVFFVWWGSFDSIGDILKDPVGYREESVCLFGKTGAAFSVPFVGSLYKLVDTSGEMWVLSENDSTREGKLMYLEAVVRADVHQDAVKLKDKLKDLFDEKILAGKQMPPVLLEKKRGGIISSFAAVRAKK
ncbi:hypothetical protein ACFL01_03270 [Planctomycetota bacterium]